MTTYIIKTILCSATLYLIYYLLLEKEKIHRFNRFYLLFSITFSFIAPLIHFKTYMVERIIPEPLYLAKNTIQSSTIQSSDLHQTISSGSDYSTLTNFLLILYISVTVFLFCRFIINIFTISSKIRKNKKVTFHGARLVLTDANHDPHSFLNYIFLNNMNFERGVIENEIFSHELAHIKQKHSLDILFIELITIFAWINPFLYLYRNSIQLNHEFLADEYVVYRYPYKHNYQLLLLDKTRKPSILVLSSSFNYLQIKKRIMMMSKITSLRMAILKKIAIIPVVVATGLLFSSRTVAQEIEKDAVVAPVKMNILYRGVSNPIEISVPGVSSDKVTASVTNGTIKKVTNGWEVSPGDQNEIVVTVLVDNKKVSDKIFRVKSIPNPVAIFAEKSEGNISKDIALKTELLDVELKDFVWDLKFTIKSFTLFCSNEKGEYEETAKGNKITDKMKSLIADCKVGQNIVFKDIQAIGPDGRSRNLNPIVLTIR
ncbi:MAG TPA: GldM family protein [Bacteroidales bacterium]|nr:GldM family protein [Bacteroidales bacterium]